MESKELTILSSQVEWDRTDATYTAEASEIGWRPGERAPSTIYLSDIPYTLHDVSVDVEGDIQWWEYRAAAGTRLIIYND